MITYSTEITSSKIQSDNPLFQRTLKAYHLVKPLVKGHSLEIGCGEGYGIGIYKTNTLSLTLIDKAKRPLKRISNIYQDCIIHQNKVPDMAFIKDNSFDTIISFQVIEHIEDYNFFLEEISRLLKPGGKAYITTPNKAKTIVRNPWHYKEFNAKELSEILSKHFLKVKIKGLLGNENTQTYYQENNKSVQRFLKFDPLNLSEKLPSTFLKIPYEIGNRINRLQLYKHHKKIVSNITLDDYSLSDDMHNALDFFCIVEN